MARVIRKEFTTIDRQGRTSNRTSSPRKYGTRVEKGTSDEARNWGAGSTGGRRALRDAV
jgi:hypothetical protein